jgi:hypothetical protein
VAKQCLTFYKQTGYGSVYEERPPQRPARNGFMVFYSGGSIVWNGWTSPRARRGRGPGEGPWPAKIFWAQIV